MQSNHKIMETKSSKLFQLPSVSPDLIAEKIFPRVIPPKVVTLEQVKDKKTMAEINEMFSEFENILKVIANLSENEKYEIPRKYNSTLDITKYSWQAMCHIEKIIDDAGYATYHFPGNSSGSIRKMSIEQKYQPESIFYSIKEPTEL